MVVSFHFNFDNLKGGKSIECFHEFQHKLTGISCKFSTFLLIVIKLPLQNKNIHYLFRSLVDSCKFSSIASKSTDFSCLLTVCELLIKTFVPQCCKIDKAIFFRRHQRFSNRVFRCRNFQLQQNHLAEGISDQFTSPFTNSSFS